MDVIGDCIVGYDFEQFVECWGLSFGDWVGDDVALNCTCVFEDETTGRVEV